MTMKTMRTFCLGWLPVLLGCLLFVACSEDEIGKSNVEEGLPASLKITLVLPDLDDVAVTRANPGIETGLNQLALFFYKKNDTSAPLHVYEVNQFGSYNLGETEQETNRIYEITIEEGAITSGEYYLYAVANWQNSFCRFSLDELKTKSLDELKQVVIAKESGSNALDLLNYTPMSGLFGEGDGSITIQEGENNFSGSDTNRVHLRRAVAKVIFNITGNEAKDVTFTPESYEIHRYSQSSTLFERTGWEGTEGTKPGTLTYAGNHEFKDFTDLKFSDATPNSFEFYMPENVQKAKTTEGLTKLLREKRVSETDETFKYASDNSTYVVINGYYKDGTYQGNVKYTILLGDFDETRGGVDNFTLRRNVKYTYNVTVNGVNNITTEAQAENFADEQQPGAEGDIIAINENSIVIPLDAHYERVLLRVPLTQFTNPFFYVTTPFGRTAEGVDPSRVEESAIPTDSKDYRWIHFAKPEGSGTNMTFGKFGNGANVTDVYHFLKEVQAYKQSGGEATHFTVENDILYTTAYVDEYFYESNPNGGALALKDFINKEDRVMNICTSKNISVDGKSTYVSNTIISFVQNSIHTVYPLDDSSIGFNPFGIEKGNEWGYVLRGSAVLSTADGMESNGWRNTKELLANDGISATNYDVTAGYVLDSKNQPVFQKNDAYAYSYLAAMSRNRDANDNGRIDEEELKWYVPARDQALALWAGDNDLGEYRPYKADGLASETNTATSKHLMHLSSNNPHATWWVVEGPSTGNVSDIKKDMRCIRNLVTRDGVPSRLSGFKDNVITLYGLSDNCLRTGAIKGEYTPFHKERDNSNLLPRAFEVATSDLVIGGKPGDSYVPTVNIKEQSHTSSGSTHTNNVTLTITMEEGHTYYANSTSSLEGATPITDGTYSGSVSGSKVTLGYTPQTYIYILAENGNYVRVKPDRSGYISHEYFATVEQGVVIDSNQPVAGKSEFTKEEIKALVNLGINYTQDGKDGWRVPNQRELMLMSVYYGNIGGWTEGKYASGTFFTAQDTGKTNPFMMVAPDSYISLYDNYTGIYRIRCVRDAEPTPQQNNENSYQSGGSVIK